jgi:hypothetical protein
MRAQLYLYDSLRSKYKEPYRLYIDTYTKRIAPVFDNIEEEANQIANEHFRGMGTYFNPDYHDEGDFAEAAWEKGLEHYEGVSLIRYNTKLMWISTMYQFWEQQVRKFLFEEISRTHKMYDKKNNEITFKSFCTRGIGEIKETFLEFNYNLESLTIWSDIDELRLLANVIKHGDGQSASQLEQLKPSFFKNQVSNSNLLELYKSTLTEIVLNIDESDFIRYGDALMKFWDELPERMYSK